MRSGSWHLARPAFRCRPGHRLCGRREFRRARLDEVHEMPGAIENMIDGRHQDLFVISEWNDDRVLPDPRECDSGGAKFGFRRVVENLDFGADGNLRYRVMTGQ